MQYLLMIYADESAEEAMSEAEMSAIVARHGTFVEELQGAGAMLGGQRLRPVETATCIRQRGGEFTLTDGPYAETKEQLGGFYMIEAASLDEAIAWGKKVPCVDYGSVEVRPIWVMDAPT